jgi:hypothetical protein
VAGVVVVIEAETQKALADALYLEDQRSAVVIEALVIVLGTLFYPGKEFYLGLPRWRV